MGYGVWGEHPPQEPDSVSGSWRDRKEASWRPAGRAAPTGLEEGREQPEEGPRGRWPK